MNNQKKQISNILKKFNAGKTKDSLFELSNLIQKKPDHLEYHFIYGQMCSQVNNLDEAEKIFHSLLKKIKTH